MICSAVRQYVNKYIEYIIELHSPVLFSLLKNVLSNSRQPNKWSLEYGRKKIPFKKIRSLSFNSVSLSFHILARFFFFSFSPKKDKKEFAKKQKLFPSNLDLNSALRTRIFIDNNLVTESFLVWMQNRPNEKCVHCKWKGNLYRPICRFNKFNKNGQTINGCVALHVSLLKFIRKWWQREVNIANKTSSNYISCLFYRTHFLSL